MKKVPLNEAVPGMVLAKHVTNASGLVVAAAGLMLDEQMIAHLERMGKAAVQVEGAPGEEAGKCLEDQERELNARFRKAGADPELTRIHEAIRRHLHGRSGVPQ
jgi:hypothetical protein